MRGAGVAAAAAGLTLMLPRRSRATWGDIPGAVWPGGSPDCKVLEVFLYGGLSPWETFYAQPNVGDGFRGAKTALESLDWGCTGSPSGDLETFDIGTDADGEAVHLGPLTKPLWRTDIVNRLRVVALSHDLLPHEAAIPLALTGRELGDVTLAGLGTAVAHHWHLRAPGIGPRAYVLAATGLRGNDNLQAATAVGQHPAFAQPLLVEVGDGTLLTRLERSRRREGTDELWSNLRQAYVDQTRRNGQGPRYRSNAITGYETSADAVVDADTLRSLLANAPLAASNQTSCVTRTGTTAGSGLTNTAASLNTAALLLSTAGGPRHVTVVDNGLLPLGDSTGYDTHTQDHVPRTSANLWNVLAELAAVIRTPGGPSAGMIDLDNTIILLNTEFGRTPAPTTSLDPSNPGREHWPFAYTNVLIGGPVGGGSPSVAGAIHASGFPATTGTPARPLTFGPADVHAAVMLAAGVWPFENQNFNQSAVTPAAPSDVDVAHILKADVLGA